MVLMKETTGLLVLTVLTLGTFSGLFVPAHGAASGKYFDFSVTILMENNDLQSVLSQGSFEASNANQYTLATGYSGITHPSEPNYVALLGGSTNGITGDGVCCFTVQASNLVDRLESAGVTWKAFAEDSISSGTCGFRPPRQGDHFPFIDYVDMNTPARCMNFVSTGSPSDSEFVNYLNSSNPANYVWLTPNDYDNGHMPPGSLASGDAYLAALVPKILSSGLFQNQRAALFIVYDEGNDVSCSSGGSDCVYASWSGPVAKKNFSSSNAYTHYSYAHTIDDNWGLPTLTSNDANAPIMSEFFIGNPSSPRGSCLFCLSSGTLILLAMAVGLGTVAVAVVVLSRSKRTATGGGD
jgi:phosphatidylinositol-3-phosphatase